MKNPPNSLAWTRMRQAQREVLDGLKGRTHDCEGIDERAGKFRAHLEAQAKTVTATMRRL
jgi:hypothetical protein